VCIWFFTSYADLIKRIGNGVRANEGCVCDEIRRHDVVGGQVEDS
jgi:hypothetical protein